MVKEGRPHWWCDSRRRLTLGLREEPRGWPSCSSHAHCRAPTQRSSALCGLCRHIGGSRSQFQPLYILIGSFPIDEIKLLLFVIPFCSWVMLRDLIPHWVGLLQGWPHWPRSPRPCCWRVSPWEPRVYDRSVPRSCPPEGRSSASRPSHSYSFWARLLVLGGSLPPSLGHHEQL
jgi:hypothetical protein